MPRRATVTEAVNAFLAAFRGAPNFAAATQRLLARLRNNPDWSEEEIQEVERAIADRCCVHDTSHASDNVQPATLPLDP